MDEQVIDLVVFDLGGVLVRVADSWAESLSRAGVEASAELLARIAAVDWGPVMVAYETGRLEPAAFAREVSEATGLGAEAVARVMDGWLIGPYEGVEALFDRLAAARVATACLSNTNPHHWALMSGRSHASLPLGRLDHRFASHLTGLMKPDPRAYAGLERATGVSPGALLFFDDRVPNVEAARDRGWQAVLVDPTGDPVGAVAAELSSRGILP